MLPKGDWKDFVGHVICEPDLEECGEQQIEKRRVFYARQPIWTV